MITVYTFPNTRGVRITWLLEEMAQDYQLSLVDFSKGENRSPDYLAVNPAGKVPAIVDGDLLMTESGAIVSYLADKYSCGQLIPLPATALRGRYEQWAYFAVCELEQGLWSIAKHKFALPSVQRIADMKKTAAWEFQQAVALLSSGLADRPYVLGDNFSAADILLAQTLHWALAFKQPIEQQNVVAYYHRVIGRPAFIKANKRELEALNG